MSDNEENNLRKVPSVVVGLQEVVPTKGTRLIFSQRSVMLRLMNNILIYVDNIEEIA